MNGIDSVFSDMSSNYDQRYYVLIPIRLCFNLRSTQ